MINRDVSIPITTLYIHGNIIILNHIAILDHIIYIHISIVKALLHIHVYIYSYYGNNEPQVRSLQITSSPPSSPPVFVKHL